MSRVWRKVQTDWEAWCRRSLADEDALVARITVRPESVDIAVRLTALPDMVKPDFDPKRLTGATDAPIEILSVPARVKRTGTRPTSPAFSGSASWRPRSRRRLSRAASRRS